MTTFNNETGIALIREANLTREMLGDGATQIRKANYAQNGLYFQAFTGLSTGLERIGKLCLMLDYYIDNQGTFPKFNYLKDIGHNLTDIYSKTKEIVPKQQIAFKYLCHLDDPIYQNIITVLSRFATGDRYSNINLLTKGKDQSDPIAVWRQKVDQLILDSYIPESKRTRLLHNPLSEDDEIEKLVSVRHLADDAREIDTYKSAVNESLIHGAVAPYRQLFVLDIIRVKDFPSPTKV